VPDRLKFRAILVGFVSVVVCLGLLGAELGHKKVKGKRSFFCSQKVIFNDNNRIEDKISFALNEKDFFKEHNIEVFSEDKLSKTLPFNLCKGVILKIERAPVVEVEIGGKNQIVRTWQKKVSDLLKEKKIFLGKKDRVEPNIDSLIYSGLKVRVIRIGERTEEEIVKIAFNSEQRPDNNLVRGETRVLQQGEYGEKIIVYKITSENNVDVKKEIISEKVLKQPKNRIIAYGTKPPTTYLATGQAKWYIQTNQMIGACNLVPKGTRLLVTNLANGKSVEVISSGWGAFTNPVVIDLSTSAFEKLGGNLWLGLIPNVKVEKINE